MTKVPGMFDPVANFAGITVEVDPIDRKRSEKNDNVMAIFHEEQPVWWEFSKPFIEDALFSTQGEIDFLDVGTGSGVMAILAAKHYGKLAKNILAIDKSARAIKQAAKNAKRNRVNFKLKQEFYNMNSTAYQSAKVITINAPYHLYPAEVEMKIPQHARGGVDGQQAFREQLVIADYHLAPEGVIVFNQMCLGRQGRPEFVHYVPELVRNASLVYTNIIPPIQTSVFLRAVYGSTFPEHQKEIAKAFPELYFCDGIVKRDGLGRVTEVRHQIDLQGRTWADRIKLHREIAKHAF